MRQLFTLTAVAVAVVLLAAVPIAYSQERPAPAEKTFDGMLTKIDPTAKAISVRNSDNKEMTFSYTDQTQVIGPENSIQGLAGKPGTELKVSYREDKGTNMATKIEVVQKK